MLSTIKFGVIRFPHPNWLIIALYYGFLIYLLSSCERNEFKKARNAFLSFFGVCVFWLNMAWFNPFDKVLFLDLPMGEATLIVSRFNQMNILIDTGEAGYEDVHQLLMKLGIKRIDYLILSHGDSDHAGEAWNIMNRFMVKTLVVSKYDDSIGIQKALSGKRKALSFWKRSDYLRVKPFSSPSSRKPYSSSNNNSLVLLPICLAKVFFTGDIEKEAESDWLIDSPILKLTI